MPPFNLVMQHYKMPTYINPHPLQIAAVNDLALRNEQGHFLDMGTGKTFVFTVVALYHVLTRGARIVVIMPPILLTQWKNWLDSISPKPDVMVYRGTPVQRKKMKLTAQITLVGLQIFKRDYNRFVEYFQEQPLLIGVDEATIISGIDSKAHELVYDFCVGQPRALLTGTPMNRPIDAYGILKFTAPGAYRNYKHFRNMHVEEEGLFGNPERYCNLDLLAENVRTNAQRVLYEDMYPDASQPLYVPVSYDLDPAHLSLYEELAEEQLLTLPDGGKIDATTEGKLVHALGQIILNWGYFAQDESLQPAGVDLLEQKLEELGDKKLLIFAHYKMTVSRLQSHFGKRSAGQINSQVSASQKDYAKESFINDASKRVIIVQVQSGGMGLDGFQHVCHHCIHTEPVTSPSAYHQSVRRIQRTGQKKKVMAMMMQARGTLQRRKFQQLLKNDALVNQVIRNAADLRDLLFDRGG